LEKSDTLAHCPACNYFLDISEYRFSAVDVSYFVLQMNKRETLIIAWLRFFEIGNESAVEWAYFVRTPGEEVKLASSRVRLPARLAPLPDRFLPRISFSLACIGYKNIFPFSIKGSAVVKLEPRQAGTMPSHLRGEMDRVYSAPNPAEAGSGKRIYSLATARAGVSVRIREGKLWQCE
jgi:hypothetical protein